MPKRNAEWSGSTFARSTAWEDRLVRDVDAPQDLDYEGKMIRCVKCGKEHPSRKAPNFFTKSNSPLYKGNNGLIPVCNHCIGNLFDYYKQTLSEDADVVKRLCLKFDVYWSERSYDAVVKSATSESSQAKPVWQRYFRKMASSNNPKTYDDTIDEMADRAVNVFNENETFKKKDEIVKAPEFEVTDEMRNFWGSGLSKRWYNELERRFEFWWNGSRNMDELSMEERAEIVIIKQISMLEVQICMDAADEKPIDRDIKALNDLLGSADLKPVQKNKDGAGANFEKLSFGQWIRRIEDTRPIRKVDPEFEDMDGIARYISIWYFGHMCKMLGINDSFSQLYEEELAKLTVERPEYEGEDEESIFADIFERAAQAEANRRAEMEEFREDESILALERMEAMEGGETDGAV